ncbi:hypothetical protein SAMN04488506_0205 [Desemzia incerta]|uniref:RiboL-PSP-HEPN domain-containing protein n=1 Tax=Desemzia incerta TaxID=82801 RepID=A0A1I5UV35_9LACT|nr:MAE_28990/MAE_18760 family HEPN-like nuclease [Desemzia incerta]SFP99093.1 hypothetical protein SAMN04488506_0205 [Desemzia incerta]
MDCEKLQRKLDKNTSYRKREISNLSIQIQATDGEIKDSLLRAAFTIIYAHFEGFSVEAIRLFLQHINFKEIPVKSLDYHLQTLHHTKKIIDVKKSTKKRKFNELTTAILLEKNTIFKVEEKDKSIVSAESNLKFDVIEDLLFYLGITTEKFILLSDKQSNLSTKQEFIDRSILNVRNKIAHGENVKVSIDEFEEVKSFILDYMDTLSNYIMDISINETYKMPIKEV